MMLKVLGTQSPVCKKGHNCPGFIIYDGANQVMLDCGSGTHRMLDFPDILRNLYVFITHLHRDHYNDVFNFQYASLVFHNQKRLEKPINIFMPRTPEARSEDIRSETDAYAQYHDIDEKLVVNIGEMEITFCKTDHPVETYAVRVQKGDKSIVYTSDTSYSAKDKIVEFARNADLLICESSLLKGYGFPEINSHLTAAQAAEIAKLANVRKLALTHFWFEEDVQKYVNEAKEVFENTIALSEGKIFNISDI